MPEVPKGFTIRNIADIKNPTNKLELIHFNPRQWAALMKRVKIVKTLPDTVPHRVVFQVLPWPGKDKIVMPVCDEDKGDCIPIITRDSGNVLFWGCSCGPKRRGPKDKGNSSVTPDNPCKFGLKNGVITCVGRCMGKCVMIGVAGKILFTCNCV